MLTGLRDALRGEEGISVVEVMVVTVLLGVILPPAFMFVISTQRSERQVSETTQQQQEVRGAMESFSRHLREAGYPQGLTYSQSSIFAWADEDEVTYYTDFDGDGVNERVTYALDPDAAAIDRTIVEPDCGPTKCSYTSSGATSTTVRVIEHVRNDDLAACGEPPGSTTPVFRYYQRDRGTGELTEIPSPTGNVDALVDINYVAMRLVADITPDRAPTCQQLETTVSLRNWRG